VLGLPVRVIVPKTTKPLMLDKIRAQGAEVEVSGRWWWWFVHLTGSVPPAGSRWVRSNGPIGPIHISIYPSTIHPSTHPSTHPSHQIPHNNNTQTNKQTNKVHGDNWNAADALARQLVEQDPSAAYIPPYDHPLLWEGHSTLVDELVEEMETRGGQRPAAIVASVGGGGLVCGIYEVRCCCGLLLWLLVVGGVLSRPSVGALRSAVPLRARTP
jgi:hypothetical protein